MAEIKFKINYTKKQLFSENERAVFLIFFVM